MKLNPILLHFHFINIVINASTNEFKCVFISPSTQGSYIWWCSEHISTIVATKNTISLHLGKTNNLYFTPNITVYCRMHLTEHNTYLLRYINVCILLLQLEPISATPYHCQQLFEREEYPWFDAWHILYLHAYCPQNYTTSTTTLHYLYYILPPTAEHTTIYYYTTTQYIHLCNPLRTMMRLLHSRRPKEAPSIWGTQL